MSDPDPKATTGRRSRRLRKLSGLALITFALTVTGGAYAMANPSTDAGATKAAGGSSSIAAEQGQRLYEKKCITCHGRQGQGVTGRGPSVIGGGSAAVYFQVSTGRMPLVGQDAQAERKPALYNEEQINQLGAYVDSLGGGPKAPTQSNLRGGNLAEGGQLFRLNCIQCHNFAGSGGALTSGKAAPKLTKATDKQIYTAMQSGPENMPTFGDGQISPDQKKEVINYIQSLKAEPDQGGFGLGRVGPVPEGLVAFLFGIFLVVGFTVWIGVKS